MASVADAGPGLQGQSVGMQESLAAESGVQHPSNAAESTDAETAHGARKRVSSIGFNLLVPQPFNSDDSAYYMMFLQSLRIGASDSSLG